jgi:hypothetical protein
LALPIAILPFPIIIAKDEGIAFTCHSKKIQLENTQKMEVKHFCKWCLVLEPSCTIVDFFSYSPSLGTIVPF